MVQCPTVGTVVLRKSKSCLSSSKLKYQALKETCGFSGIQILLLKINQRIGTRELGWVEVPGEFWKSRPPGSLDSAQPVGLR